MHGCDQIPACLRKSLEKVVLHVPKGVSDSIFKRRNKLEVSWILHQQKRRYKQVTKSTPASAYPDSYPSISFAKQAGSPVRQSSLASPTMGDLQHGDLRCCLCDAHRSKAVSIKGCYRTSSAREKNIHFQARLSV